MGERVDRRAGHARASTGRHIYMAVEKKMIKGASILIGRLLGPTDLLCCNFLLQHDESEYRTSGSF